MYPITRLEAQQLAHRATGGPAELPGIVESALSPLLNLPGMRWIAVLWQVEGGPPRGLLARSPQWAPIRPGSLEWPALLQLGADAGPKAISALLGALELPQPDPGEETALLPLGQEGLLLAQRGVPGNLGPSLPAILRHRGALLASLLPLTRLEWPDEADPVRPPATVLVGAPSEALARLSHELRGPLSVITGYAQVLTQDPPTSPARARFIDHIRNEALHLSAVVEDVLIYADLDLGRSPLNPIPLRVDTVLTEVAQECAASAGVSQTRVQLDLQDLGGHEAMVDGPGFRRIVGNLLFNALQHDSLNPILLRASRNGDRVLIEVEDRGTGIPETLVDSVFEPFRMPASRGSGHGLGMAIAHATARRMGGSLSLRHNGRSGSCFSLSLAMPPVGDSPATRPPSAPDLEGRRVLVVEDSPEIQFILREYLRPTGATVVQVYDGQSAVNQVLALAAAGKAVDLLLMDHQLPELDGYSAAQKIRQHFPNLPIIAITGAGIETNRQLAERSGCTAWLPKPIRRADLMRTIRTLLDPLASSVVSLSPEQEQPASWPQPGPAAGALAELADLDFQEDLRARYRLRLATRLEGLAQSRQVQDLDAARRIAHQLRGSAASFGYSTLGGFAERAEEAILHGRPRGQVEARLDELASEIQRVLGSEQSTASPA